jgi:tRNA1Val (adenine37-N6)-methyltransferase
MQNSIKFKQLFKFKQFDVYQDLAAMKIGTDGVLLGAWTENTNANNILDIGTGTGVIALMMAQKNKKAKIDAIEIDKNAFLQATYNFSISKWKKRLTAIHTGLQLFTPEIKYDIIVSNPPFFDEKFFAKTKARNTARHTGSLDLETLLKLSSNMLKINGFVYLILPFNKENSLKKIAQKNNLFINKITYVKGSLSSKIKRILVMLSFKQNIIYKNELVIEISRHNYTQSYRLLTRDFYLKM